MNVLLRPHDHRYGAAYTYPKSFDTAHFLTLQSKLLGQVEHQGGLRKTNLAATPLRTQRSRLMFLQETPENSIWTEGVKTQATKE